MGLSDPKTWLDGVSAVFGASHIVAPLIIVAMGFAWWLRGTIERSVRNGLGAQVGALRERLMLAHDQQRGVTSNLDAAQAELAALHRQASSPAPMTLNEIAGALAALQQTASANAALGYVLRPDAEEYAKGWQDHARMVAMMEKIAFTVDYDDGRTARMYVSQWDVRSGDDVVNVIARERQNEGSLPTGKIKSFRREPAG